MKGPVADIDARLPVIDRSDSFLVYLAIDPLCRRVIQDLAHFVGNVALGLDMARSSKQVPVLLSTETIFHRPESSSIYAPR